MTARRSLSRLTRVRIFDNAKGICCLCKLKIHAERGGKWIVEHIKPLWLNGPDDESNMGPAHENCAKDKTRSEAPVKAKSDRIRANYLGIRKPKQLIPGSKGTPYRKRVDGRVERRT